MSDSAIFTEEGWLAIDSLSEVTPELVRSAVAEIASSVGDPESAHGLEDSLRHAVLAAIAEGSDCGRELSIEVLKTSELKFDRWYA